MPEALVNRPLGFRLRGMDIRRLKPVEAEAVELPDDLILAPGLYRVHGAVWDLRQEGLYRLMLPGQDNQQRMVYRRDVPLLLSSIAWLSSHGSRDNLLPIPDCLAKARAEKLIVTCGKIADIGCAVCDSLGLSTRRVSCRTLDELNTYDNGHQLMEIKLGGRWVLADLDVKVLFVADGQRLNLQQFALASQTGEYEFEQLSPAAGIAVGCFNEGGYDYGLFMETTFSTEAWLRRWYKRIVQVPEIQRHCTMPTAAGRRKALAWYPERNYTALTPEEFAGRFYA